MNNKDIHLELLKKIEENPEYTQRELSKEMGVSLGKINSYLSWVFSPNFSYTFISEFIERSGEYKSILKEFSRSDEHTS